MAPNFMQKPEAQSNRRQEREQRSRAKLLARIEWALAQEKRRLRHALALITLWGTTVAAAVALMLIFDPGSGGS